MNLAELILAIVVVVAGARLLRERGRGWSRVSTDAQVPAAAGDLRTVAEELARLRERVQVLERLATDGHQASELDREIGRLRER